MKSKPQPKGEIDMEAVTARVNTLPAGNVREMAFRIATSSPTLASLNVAELESLAKIVVTQNLAKELAAAAALAGIDYEAEKRTFLESAGKTHSNHTRLAYRHGLNSLEAWAAREKINVLELTPAKADDFIYSLRGRSSAYVRIDVAACSSFFNFLERRHASLKNPFRGTKARPAKKAARKTEIPSEAEVETILKNLRPYEAAAASVMVFRGLRAGGLPEMTIKGTRFETRSKGKDLSGELPPQALQAIRAAGLPPKTPFAGILPNTLEKRIAFHLGKLHKAGKIAAPYSSHDLRHSYAVREYRQNKDIHRLSKLLGHASIQVTETYLKGLGEYD